MKKLYLAVIVISLLLLGTRFIDAASCCAPHYFVSWQNGAWVEPATSITYYGIEGGLFEPPFWFVESPYEEPACDDWSSRFSDEPVPPYPPGYGEGGYGWMWWHVGPNQAGNYEVDIRLTDDCGGVQTLTFHYVVSPNNPPQFIYPAEGQQFNVTAGKMLWFYVNLTDPDTLFPTTCPPVGFNCAEFVESLHLTTITHPGLKASPIQRYGQHTIV